PQDLSVQALAFTGDKNAISGRDYHDVLITSSVAGASSNYGLLFTGKKLASLETGVVLSANDAAVTMPFFTSTFYSTAPQPIPTKNTYVANNPAVTFPENNTFSSSAVPLTIPDATQTTTTKNYGSTTATPINDATFTGPTVNDLSFAINDDALILSLEVTINLQHTYDGDLSISLISPSGLSVLLSNRRGGSGDNYTGTTFSDASSILIASGVAPSNAVPKYRPEQSLAAFAGQSTKGTWKLRVIDHAQLDVGTINSVSLSVLTPGTITDGVVSATIPVSGFSSTAQLTDINVTIDLDHTRDSDLELFLVSPDPDGSGPLSSTQVTLVSRKGGDGDNFSTTIFDDDGTSSIATGQAPFNGRFNVDGTSGALANFRGLSGA
ncbi:MAG: proprotein convertase P-domain-containing protein, partial [Planctomycetota bacterium]